MNNDGLKIVIKDNKIVSMKELYEGKEKSRREIAKISFPEKIKALIALQKIAVGWGKKKDVIIWSF